MNGVNLLVDTNIIIYYLKGYQDTKSLILDNEIFISYITEIEVLGYHKISTADTKKVRRLFSSFTTLYSNDYIKEGAIELRRKHNIKTPDSIIGATAIHNNLPVVTADSGLFKVPDLTTIKFSL